MPHNTLGSYLRAAVLTEEVRWNEYERISRAVLPALDGAGIASVVVGGAPDVLITRPRR